MLTQWANVAMRKEAIPLRRNLPQLAEAKLRPYEVAFERDLESSILNELGTTEYIDWLLLDSRIASESDPERVGRLFVTYYTGNPDTVPHIPDVCLVGSGYTATNKKNITLDLDTRIGRMDVPVRVVDFEKSAVYNSEKFTVVYTFHANGSFYATREGVRLAINAPADKHAYYSKVEIGFGRRSHPTREETIEAAKRLLTVALPILIEDHWPDWEAVKAAEQAEDAKAADASEDA